MAEAEEVLEEVGAVADMVVAATLLGVEAIEVVIEAGVAGTLHTRNDIDSILRHMFDHGPGLRRKNGKV